MRMIVRVGILSMIAQEVTDLCVESHHPAPGIYSRAGSGKADSTSSSQSKPRFPAR
jgi:hypothetical protein